MSTAERRAPRIPESRGECDAQSGPCEGARNAHRVPTPSMNSLAAGTLLDQRYELVTPLADRGLGETWEARDQQHGGRAVAVKLLRPVEGGEVPRALAEFIKSLRALRNDHVLTVINHGVWSGRPYLVYDRFDGRSIGDALDDARRRDERLDLQLLAAVFERCCLALQAGHKSPRPVLHLALTPGGVLFRGNAADVAVRVLDFGMAKHAGADPTAPPRSARALRSPAPEQLSPEGQPGVAADVFGLGALLREMLSLPAPLGLTLSPAGIERRRDDVPAGLWEVTTRALAPRPDDRFPTVAALLDATRLAWKTAPPSPKRPSDGGTEPRERPAPASGATVDELAARAPRLAAPLPAPEASPLPIAGPLPAPRGMALPPPATPLPAFVITPPTPTAAAAPAFPTEEDEDSLLSTVAMDRPRFHEAPPEAPPSEAISEATQTYDTPRAAVTDVPAAVSETQDVGAAAEEFLATMTTASPLPQHEVPGVGERTRFAGDGVDAPLVGERTRVVFETEEDEQLHTLAVDQVALQRIAGAPSAAQAPPPPSPPPDRAPPAVERAPAAEPVAPEETTRYKLIVAVGILFIPVLLGLLLILRGRR